MSEELAATDPTVATRRTLLLGVGAVGATAALAACGTDDSGGEATGTKTSAAPPSPTGGQTEGDAGGGVKLAAAADIPVGGGVIFASQGVVVTQPTAGTFKGFSHICTHQGCPVANVDGGTINCTCHRSKFSIEDGSVTTGPAKKPLGAKTVTKNGDDILLG